MSIHRGKDTEDVVNIHNRILLALKESEIQPLAATWTDLQIVMGFPGGSDAKESACNAADPGSIPGSGRSPGGGPGSLLPQVRGGSGTNWVNRVRGVEFQTSR